jgi:hypothetical protein
VSAEENDLLTTSGGAGIEDEWYQEPKLSDKWD